MNSKRKLVIEKLLQKIHSGEIVLNDKLLPERQLVDAVGETRPVLREGLSRLRQWEYLTSETGKEFIFLL
jgi:GntR family transcriptional repressor for pyruvate dehydrogenase complex